MDFLMENALRNQEQFKFSSSNNAGQANIKVIGCGGAGNNTVAWLYNKGVEGAETIVLNTDLQHLNISNADQKILVGKELTRGLGAGGHPQIGAQAVEESQYEVKQMLKGTDLLFICAGMGGGTGTGSAPVVAKLAKEIGSIVIGVVTMPFDVERARVDKAEYGLQLLREYCDSVIVIDNNRLIKIAGNLPISQSFAVANELISTMIKGIVETIALPSLINLDFADVKAIMKMGGLCIMGIGESNSDKKAEEAVRKALNNPLLEVDYSGAEGALIHITGGADMTLEEANKAAEIITSSLNADANVIWGARIEEGMAGKMRIMSIITGVKSPYIMGPQRTSQMQSNPAGAKSESLGIKMI
ncbi:MAG: cell division protein FtsZ [Candidatus Nanoarchaeia archaeon]|nr:cell division protein FtsZ [Candidatus Nanoarchaeia archaeon]MDD5053760.1 cell division protein FtsZ [Candidatus Nanoarchaeia archaeon]MDD5499965.1 cell division protein FtsZ [Candidatus Nanoarchaeia archaeon]